MVQTNIDTTIIFQRKSTIIHKCFNTVTVLFVISDVVLTAGSLWAKISIKTWSLSVRSTRTEILFDTWSYWKYLTCLYCYYFPFMPLFGLTAQCLSIWNKFQWQDNSPGSPSPIHAQWICWFHPWNCAWRRHTTVGSDSCWWRPGCRLLGSQHWYRVKMDYDKQLCDKPSSCEPRCDTEPDTGRRWW